MPATFSHRRAQFYVPLQRKLDPATRGNHFLPTYARLKKGVTLDRATAEMRALGQTLAAEFGNNHGVDVRSYYEVIVGGVRRLALGADGGRAAGAADCVRQCREPAARRGHGAAARVCDPHGAWRRTRRAGAPARRRRACCSAATGGALGMLLARWMVGVFVVLAGNQLPRATTIEIDGRVLAFAAVTSLLVGVFCGVWPLLRLRPRDLTAPCAKETRGRRARGGRRIGNGLVVAEIAIAFALLVGAGCSSRI